MGFIVLRLKLELEKKWVIDMEKPKNKKSIAITRSFEKSITDYSELKERISTFAMVCSEKLRKQKSCCYNVIIYLRKDKYKNPNERYNFYKMQSLPFATNSGITISNIAIKMLSEIYTKGEIYKKAGVIVTQIIPEDKKQFHLFEEENPKHQLLMKIMDDFQRKTGERKIKLGNQDLNRTWKMKQNHLSRKYTTNIKEILEVKC